MDLYGVYTHIIVLGKYFLCKTQLPLLENVTLCAILPFTILTQQPFPLKEKLLIFAMITQPRAALHGNTQFGKDFT